MVEVGTKLGRYEVVKHLARGGMADLLVARASGLQGFERHVVLKCLRSQQAEDAAFVDMFVTEARLAGALHHHNIVQVLDIGQEDGKHFFAMEYVHGEDVRRLLEQLSARKSQPPIQHVVAIMTAVAAALHHAHEQKGSDLKPLGIVHRDVSPANIIIAYDGNVKVVDFGIAKAAMRTSETQAGMLKGKVPYMAPEQCTGKPVDRRSDVFALGIVLYELVTVRRLFKGDNEFFTMSALVQGEIPRPSLHRADLPKPLENIILKALAREPSDRYQTAEEMRAALEDFADKAGLRMSTSTLANYMKKLFGKRPEPWMLDAEPTLQIKIDFDGARTGLVSAPTEVMENPKSMMTAKGSLIEQARLNALSSELEPTKAGKIPSLVAKKKQANGSRSKPTTPPRISTSEDTTPAVKANGVPSRSPSSDDTRPDDTRPDVKPVPELTRPPIVAGAKPDERTPTDVDEATDVAAPPPPPSKLAIEGFRPDREPTAIVTPLPPPCLERPKSRGVSVMQLDLDEPPTRDRKWLLAAGVAAAALTIAIVMVMTGSKSVEKASQPVLDLKPAEPNAPAPPAIEVAQPTETKPAEPAIEPKLEPAPEPAIEPKLEPIEPNTEPAIEPKIEPPPEVATKPEPAPEPAPTVEPRRKPTVKTPPRRKPPIVSKTQPKKPAKPKVLRADTKPKWDPNALFLKKK